MKPGFAAVLAQVTFSVVLLSSSISHAFNQNAVQAQQMAVRIYAKVISENKVYARSVVNHADHWDYYCSEVCACLNQEFRQPLANAGFETRTINVYKLGFESIRLRGVPPDAVTGPVSFDYHVATAIHIGNAWWVVDPISIRSAQFERFESWRSRILTPVSIRVSNVAPAK